MEIKFSSDTKHRKQWLTGVHFSHPAKLHLSLQLWLIDRYTKEGDTILDPMGGTGTILVACSMGRDVCYVELEQKFVDMAKGNWQKIQQRGPQMGYKMGEAVILQGDARNLEGLLTDKVIFSPPYAASANVQQQERVKRGYFKKKDGKPASGFLGKMEVPERDDNIGNLPYGEIDAVITSPPYAKTLQADNDSGQRRIERLRKEGHDDIADRIEKAHNWHQHEADYNPDNPDNIGNLPYGSVDAVITSPPYGNPRSTSEEYDDKYDLRRPPGVAWGRESFRGRYGNTPGQIGDLPYGADIGDTYLGAMRIVYQNCWRVLKPGGLMILITKNFIRNKQIVPLDEHTIKLCESVGFKLKERHYRILTQQSFWRTIYAKKYPKAPLIDKEHILIFSVKKGG